MPAGPSGGQADERPVRPPNPLLDRVKWERDGLHLIAELERLTGKDPIEILAAASTGFGKGAWDPKIRLDTMPDDRLIRTVRDLRAWSERLRPSPQETPIPQAPPPDQDAAATWEAICRELAQHTSRPEYATWLLPTTGQRWSDDGSRLYVLVPTAEHASWIRESYGARIGDARKALGLTCTVSLEVLVVDRAPPLHARERGPDAAEAEV